MDNDAFLRNFISAIEASDVNVALDARLEDIPEWDSVAYLTAISMIDSEYEVEISGTELQACATIGDIAALVARKLG
jgi:acyl carrier protein